MIRRKTGFTLTELIITMAILGLALAMTSDMFVGMLRGYKQQGKIAESNIEGVIGLEILRQDIERAGYGLPWVIPSTVTYNEAAAAPASSYNDCPSPCNPPRPILSSSGTYTNALLVIKAANVPRNATSQKWAYLTSSVTKTWDVAAENLANSDYVIVLSPGVADTDVRTLVQGSSPNPWSPLFSDLAASGFVPGAQDPQPVFVYGIGTSNPRMPFNRADYYILGPADTSMIPSRCAPNTGVLVKSIISQSDGSRSDVLPLLDCVADMKVIFRLDTDGDGQPDTVSDNLVGLTAQQLRTQVKEVRVYILAQEGAQDRSYTNSQPTIYVGDPNIDGGTTPHNFNVGTDVNYRWKLYTIVVQPKNMRQ